MAAGSELLPAGGSSARAVEIKSAAAVVKRAICVRTGMLQDVVRCRPLPSHETTQPGASFAMRLAAGSQGSPAISGRL
jgi:hypothetical protein